MCGGVTVTDTSGGDIGLDVAIDALGVTIDALDVAVDALDVAVDALDVAVDACSILGVTVDALDGAVDSLGGAVDALDACSIVGCGVAIVADDVELDVKTHQNQTQGAAVVAPAPGTGGLTPRTVG